MEDYHNLQLKYDFLLLAYVFKKFRNRCLENYSFCLSHFLRESAISSDAILSMTKVRSYFRIWHVLVFWKRHERWCFLYLQKIQQSKNKYLTSYDPKKLIKYIKYSDKNNLFCYDMSKSLPMGGFKWFDSEKCDINKYNDNSFRGCVLEVNLGYSKELHEFHNDYPLAEDNSEFKIKMLSNYTILLMTIIFLLVMLEDYFLTCSTKENTCFITNICGIY